MKILDVGCGAGTKSKYLTDKGLKVVGIDFSDKMIEIAKKQVPSATFLTLDLREVETLEQMFDAIFMQAVLLHIPKNEAEKVIRKIVKDQKIKVLQLFGKKGIHRKGDQALLLKGNIHDIRRGPQNNEGKQVNGGVILEGNSHEPVIQARSP